MVIIIFIKCSDHYSNLFSTETSIFQHDHSDYLALLHPLFRYANIFL